MTFKGISLKLKQKEGGIVMLEWVLRVVDRVDALAATDPEYRELLLEYMDIVGNMQYRTTQIAWLYGKLHPDR